MRYIYYFLCGIILILNIYSCCSISELHNNKWICEDSSGKKNITYKNDTIDIISPGGLTLWYNRKLTGNYKITYSALVIDEGGPYDRISDLNCFWGAKDPQYPENIYARSEWRKGVFGHYDTLQLFYVGYGGNKNTTTRFRLYKGMCLSTSSKNVKPIIKEYTDKKHLLNDRCWYEITILVKDDKTSYMVNGKELFTYKITRGQCDGYFAIRLWKNHIQLTKFNIKQL